MRPVQRWVAIVSRLKKKSGSPEKNFGKCCTNETSGELPQDGATHHLHSGYLLPQVQLITFTQPPPKESDLESNSIYSIHSDKYTYTQQAMYADIGFNLLI